MPWKIQLNADLGIVEILYVGDLSPADLRAAAAEGLRVATAAGTGRFLADCRHLGGGHTLADLYFLADLVSQMPMAHPLVEAVLLPDGPAARNRVQFWEDTGTTHGLTVLGFKDREAAVEWLGQHAPRPTGRGAG